MKKTRFSEFSTPCAAFVLSPASRRPWQAHLLLVLALIGAISPGLVVAQSYLPPIGGPGGGQFKVPCPPGQYLAGFELRAGDDVDAIRPVCASSTAALANTAWFGGPGGKPVQLRCPSQIPAVIGLDVAAEGAETVVVNNIHLYCGLPLPNQRQPDYPSAVFDGPTAVASRPAFPGAIGGAPVQKSENFQSCPAGQIATGVHGRSGVWFDAMGLICGLPPAPPPGIPVASIGRVNTGSTLPAGSDAPICNTARSARARNSPAAPSLEAQCNAANAQIIANQKAASTQIAENEKKDMAPGASGVPTSICDAAQTALSHNAPESADLAAKCRASGGGQNLTSEADQYAASGEALAQGDALIAAGRSEQPSAPLRRGFDIGIAVTGSDTVWGPGKQRILESLTPTEQEGFKVAASFVLDRNRNAQLAATGAAIAAADPIVAQAMLKEQDFRYWLGFDIASGIFGDPALGAQGNKATGPGSERIRNGLSAPAQRGYNASTQLHLSRSY